jgi:L-rhamnose-H+ transport protein
MLVGSASIDRKDVPFLVVGLALMLVGIALCCRASILRDRRVDARPDVPVDAGRRSTPLIGVLIALLSGVLSAMLNTGFAYGAPLMESAKAAGVREDATTLAVWVPALWGGLLVNVAGTAIKIHRHRGWSNFAASGAGDYARAIVMGVLWLLAILIYGVSSTFLGSGGTVYGYAVVNCVSILAATAWGLKTGEWHGASTAARTWLYVGTGALVAAFWILTRSGGV